MPRAHHALHRITAPAITSALRVPVPCLLPASPGLPASGVEDIAGLEDVRSNLKGAYVPLLREMLNAQEVA